jgi:anthranilate synthase component 1
VKDRAGLPVDALLGLQARFPHRYPVLFESVGGNAALGRHDVLLCLPGERLIACPDGRLEGRSPTPNGRFLDALDYWWRNETRSGVELTGSPFVGGWFVYAGYELAGEIEPSLRLPQPRHARAIAWRMRGAVVRDRLTGVTSFHAEAGREEALRAEVERDLASAPAEASGSIDLLNGDVTEELPEVFLGGVRSVLEAIARGDVYQANLSRGWSAQLADGASPARLYQKLREANPAPFAGIATLPGFTLLSSSPERLLRIRDGIASTRPIAGTRPRGRTSAADDTLKRDLVLNAKERAEHVMLVDLERNDLGRICRGGTVRVDEYMTVETYATVHHIVSNVIGELSEDITPGRAIAAVFPGGTITGCPKVRCMDLLAGLEAAPRDAYTGSMGYLGLDGSLDLNILIRTLTVCGDRVEFRTGAGIVADSDPSAELEETRAKAQGLRLALGRLE